MKIIEKLPKSLPAGFLSTVKETGPIPNCGFYLPVYMSRNDPVCNRHEINILSCFWWYIHTRKGTHIHTHTYIHTHTSRRTNPPEYFQRKISGSRHCCYMRVDGFEARSEAPSYRNLSYTQAARKASWNKAGVEPVH